MSDDPGSDPGETGAPHDPGGPGDGGGIPDTLAASLGPVRALLERPRPHGLSDLASSTGFEVDDLRRLFTAAGRLHSDDRYGDDDAAYARDLALLVGRSSLETVEHEVRLRVRAMTQIVVNDLTAIRHDRALLDLLEGDEVDPERIGAVLAEAAEVILPAMGRQLQADYEAILRRLLDTTVVQQASADARQPILLAVGFVDLVGFTSLSREVAPQVVGDVLTAFESLVADVVDDVGEVLLAKTIGDAAMLVGGDLDRVVRVLSQVVEAEQAGLEDIERRAGASHGEVLVRDGDYVGTPVNTAARLTDLARPGSVLVDADVADHLAEEAWETRRVPPKHLKGLGTSRPIRVRPSAR